MSHTAVRDPKGTSSRPVLLAHWFVLCGLVLAAGVGASLQFRPETLVYAASLTLTVLCIWLLWSWHRVAGTLFNPYGFFLIASIVFHSGHAVLQTLGLNTTGVGTSYGLLWGRFSSSTVLETLYLIGLSLSCFHLGGLLTASRSAEESPIRHPISSNEPPVRAVRLVGWLLLGVSIVPAILVLADNVAIVSSSGYSALYQRTITIGLENWKMVLSSFLVPAALFLLAGSGGRKLEITVSAVCIAATFVVWTFLGARSTAVMPLIAYAWLWHRHIRALPTAAVMSAAGVLMFGLFPLIAAVRGDSGSGRFSVNVLLSAYGAIQSPFVAILNEMGGTAITVAYTLELVPVTRGFDWGSGYVHAVLNILPNFFSWMHFQLPYGLPRNWLTWRIDPSAPAGSLGYSFIAEAYLSFGWFGIPLTMAAIGWLVGKLTKWGNTGLVQAATVATILSSLPHYTRGEAEELVRPIFWYALVPYLLVIFLNKYQYRSPLKTLSIGSEKAN